MVIGIIILFLGTSLIPIISGNIEIENSKTIGSSEKGFWKHENVTQYNITNEWTLRAPEFNLINTPYNFMDFSICPSQHTDNYDPYIVWINDSTGDKGSLMWKNIITSDHASFSLQIDQEGYIWATVGGYGDVNPFDLYKSDTKCSTDDYLGYTLLLDNYWSVIGSCDAVVMVLGDKVNLFFRNWWNDDPNTGIQQLQYAIDDFSTPLINREIAKGEWFEDLPLTTAYIWGRIDPRYNAGLLTISYKHTLAPPPGPKYWGSNPFIITKNNGDALKDGFDQTYSLPIRYSINADIPYDNIRMNKEASSDGYQLGVTPNGKYYLLTHWRDFSGGPKHFKLFIHNGSAWNEVWNETTMNVYTVACGVTKDYVVLLYTKEDNYNRMYVDVSDDDGDTWYNEELIIEETNPINGIGIAQPVLDYTDNILRFFYGKTNDDPVSSLYSKYQFAKFDASQFYIPDDPPDTPETPSGPTSGSIFKEYSYNTSTTDPDDDQVLYNFTWGDGNNSGWLGPYDSGESISASHVWTYPDDYEVRVRAKDDRGLMGNWSEPLAVTITGPIFEIGEMKGGLFKAKTTVKNIGTGDAVDVEWHIDINGGFIFAGQQSYGTIDSILAGEEVVLKSNLILGFGNVIITAKVEMTDIASDSKDFDAKVFLIFIRI